VISHSEATGLHGGLQVALNEEGIGEWLGGQKSDRICAAGVEPVSSELMSTQLLSGKFTFGKPQI
jgi:hypothetical protein